MIHLLENRLPYPDIVKMLIICLTLFIFILNITMSYTVISFMHMK